MRFLLKVAWRNVWRQKRRSLITAAAMAVAVGLCMAIIAINDGSMQMMFELMVEQQTGHVQVHHRDYPSSREMFDTLPKGQQVLARVTDMPQTRAAGGRLKAFGLAGGADKSTGVQLVGIDPERERSLTPLHERIKEGQFLSAERSHQVLLGVGLAKELSLGVGDELVVITQAADGSMGNDLYQVAGLYRSGSVLMDRGGLYMHLEDLQELLVMPGQIHEVILLARDDKNLAAYAEAVQSALVESELMSVSDEDLTEVTPWWVASPTTDEMLKMTDASSGFILGIVFLVSGFGILNTMLMSVFERTRELGVLMALGLRRSRLIIMIVFESVFLAGIAAVAGAVLGGALDFYLVTYGLDFSGSMEEGFSFSGVVFDPVFKGKVRAKGIVMTMGALFSIAVLASLWPAWRAAGLRPADAIHED